MQSVRFIGTNSPLNDIQAATIQECQAYCESKTVLGVDTETEGFDFTCKKLIMFQIGDRDRQYVIDTREVDITPLRHILESDKIVKVLYNAKFDYKFIKKWAGISLEEHTIRFLSKEFSIAVARPWILSCQVHRDTSIKFSIKRRVTNSSDSKVNLTPSIKLRTGRTMWFISRYSGETAALLRNFELEQVARLENKVVITGDRVRRSQH